jgi:15-cis-phytoene synthase
MLQLSESPTIFVPDRSVETAYEQCRKMTAQFSTTFYWATLLMPGSKRQAIWAIYVWCRRTDELVDGPNCALTTLETLDAWETRLEGIFAGRPVDEADLALTDTIQSFPLDIQPFRDMIAGQRMDLKRSRYQTFDDLKLYCYRVAGTVGLMSTVIMGVDIPKSISPWSQNLRDLYTPTEEAVALGIANQLTNILRDVGEDAHRGRIYLPLEDLERFDYTEQDLLKGVNDCRWKALMQYQIERARAFYATAEAGIGRLCEEARLPVWASLLHYSQILDVIERNDYDVFTRRAFVSDFRKLLSLPTAFMRAQVL